MQYEAAFSKTDNVKHFRSENVVIARYMRASMPMTRSSSRRTGAMERILKISIAICNNGFVTVLISISYSTSLISVFSEDNLIQVSSTALSIMIVQPSVFKIAIDHISKSIVVHCHLKRNIKPNPICQNLQLEKLLVICTYLFDCLYEPFSAYHIRFQISNGIYG